MQLTKPAGPAGFGGSSPRANTAGGLGGSSPRANTAGWALALTSVAFFMTALDALVVITALPAIHAGLGGSVATLEWTVNAYTLTLAAGIITAAALGDRLGRRRVYVAGLLAFTVASAACALAPTTGLLIAARAVQGLGAALITPLSLTILASAFPPRAARKHRRHLGRCRRPGDRRRTAHWRSGRAGPGLALDLLAERAGGPGRCGAIGRPSCRRATAREPGWICPAWCSPRRARWRWLGHWSGPPPSAGRASQVIGSLCLAAALFAAFALWERRASEPMLPMRLLRVPAFAAANATSFAMMASITSAAFLMSQYFQLGLGHSPLSTGLRFLPWTLTPLLIAPAAGAWPTGSARGR